MKIKKMLAMLLCIAMVASVLAACGGETTDATEPGEKIEIHYAYWQETLGTYLNEVKADFEQRSLTSDLGSNRGGRRWSKERFRYLHCLPNLRFLE